MLEGNIKEAIEKCIRLGIHFAAYSYPGCDEVYFIADSDTDHRSENQKNVFVISPFGRNNREAQIEISANLTVDEIIALPEYDRSTAPAVSESIMQESTLYDDYLRQAESIISHKQGTTGKTVLSRVVAVSSTISPIEVADAYFDKHPHCFRCIYYTRNTGLWFTATPELLIDYDVTGCAVTSMSLAGTRKVRNGSEHWDEKNKQEHEPVTKHIADVFSKFGLSPDVHAPECVKFGEIEHLCHMVTGHGCIDDFSELVSALSPTPAVCGWPIDHAYNEIMSLEKHQRYCYGGYIGVKADDCIRLFVNLRCAMAERAGTDGYRYNLFAGGGINSMSIADQEWLEAAYKMNSLFEIVVDTSSNSAVKSPFYPLDRPKYQ